MKIPENVEDLYLAFVLTDECRKELLKLYPNRFDVVKCDHVTIQYDINKEELKKFQPIFDANEFKLNGFIEADGIDLFRVTVDGNSQRPDGNFYHLTFTRTKERASSDSNKVLAGEIISSGNFHAGFKLNGTLRFLSK